MDTLGGIVINLNTYGATVRLDDGDLATAPASEVESHRDQYLRSWRAASDWPLRCAATGAAAPFP